MADGKSVYIAIASDAMIARLNFLRKVQDLRERVIKQMDQAKELAEAGQVNKKHEASDEFDKVIALGKAFTFLLEDLAEDDLPAMQSLVAKIDSTLESIKAKLG